jgi:CheY-like chemotaxis protein
LLIADDDPSVLGAVAERCGRLGFDVETATNGLQALIKASEQAFDTIIIDVHLPELDGLSALAYLQEIGRKSPQVMVVTGRPGQEIAEACKGFDALCIHKGHRFWNEFEAGLCSIYPALAATLDQLRRQSSTIPVKRSPRVLLVDDDPDVKEFFFSRFKRLGVDLLYASDAARGFWKARREQPSVIVSDYYMPEGDAEYLLSRLRSTPETVAIPVIVQSGRPLASPIKQRLQQPVCGRPGVTRILRKSSDTRALYDALQRLCGFPVNWDGDVLYQ